MIYDIGANLFSKQFKEPEKILEDAAKEDIRCIVTCCSKRDNKQIVEFIKNHDCYGTMGIHPHNAKDLTQDDLDFIRNHINDDRIVAVGECGLDYDRMFSPVSDQLNALDAQIRIAEENNKPMFLHERSAHEDFVHVFEKHPDIIQNCVVHCFTGNIDELCDYQNRGFWIGITGWICDDIRGKDLQNAVTAVDLDKLMVETDAPYLKPKFLRGTRINVPNNVIYVINKIAEIRKMDKEELIQKLEKNTKKFFRLS